MNYHQKSLYYFPTQTTENSVVYIITILSKLLFCKNCPMPPHGALLIWGFSFIMGFPGGLDSKESAYNVEDLGSVSGLGKSPRGRHGNPLQYSFLENPHGQRSLACCSPWGHKESEQLSTHNTLSRLSKVSGLRPLPCSLQRAKGARS